MYATLLELVPKLVTRREGIVTGWSPHADPVWRRGDYWVRVDRPPRCSCWSGPATATRRWSNGRT